MKNHKIDEAINIAALIKKRWENSLSEKESDYLEQWANADEKNRYLLNELSKKINIKEELLNIENYNIDEQIKQIFLSVNLFSDNEHNSLFVAKSNKKIKSKWSVAVSLFILFIGFGSLSVWKIFHKSNSNTHLIISQTKGKLFPGGNHAVLTLANGKKILLDTVSNGVINTQDNTVITNLKGGKLSYSGNNSNSNILNTISTPRGGQYQLVLADGTKVWLNSASELRYPISFNSNQRNVILKGEAYFEVTKNKKNPFVVEVNNIKIKVLGTHFNVMAYNDEASIKTTLIEGSVKVIKSKDSVLINSGQQAVSSNADNESGFMINKADTDEVLAWTKGEFLFRSTPVKNIMRQLARWYDADIEYVDNNIDDIKFSGGIKRQQNIEDLLDIFETDGRIKFVVKGKKIIVSKS